MRTAATTRAGLPLLAALTALALAAAGCGGGDDRPDAGGTASALAGSAIPSSSGGVATDGTSSSATVISDSTDVTGSGEGAPDGGTVTGPTPCPAADGTSPRVVHFDQPPPKCIDTSLTYTAAVATTKGTFAIALDDDHAPVTVNNFVVLARYHYFNGNPVHRIIPNFVIQTGDATGRPPGTGGPGYHIADELPTDGYPDYSVAMANGATPNNSGSQWFVVMPGGGAQLPPTSSKFGQVITGQDVVRTIDAAGSPDNSGTPTEAITVQSVTIIQG
jgi:cyclophilin family peptidyl-prolyl cis-trans isomerase